MTERVRNWVDEEAEEAARELEDWYRDEGYGEGMSDDD